MCAHEKARPYGRAFSYASEIFYEDRDDGVSRRNVEDHEDEFAQESRGNKAHALPSADNAEDERGQEIDKLAECRRERKAADEITDKRGGVAEKEIDEARWREIRQGASSNRRGR